MARRKARRIIRKILRRLVQPIDRLAYRQFFDYPFGRSPKATADRYMEIWNKAKNTQYPIVDQFEEDQGYAIDQDWLHDAALVTQVVVKKSDICYQHGRLLYCALSEYIAQNKHDSVNILETGTARGFSCLCMAKALQDAGRPGKIVTMDVLHHDVEMYWNCIADTKGPMSRAQLLHDYQTLIENYIIFIQGDSKLQLKKAIMPRTHFAFLDGAHTYENVLNEFEYLVDKQQQGDVVFFDDYTPEAFPGIVQAVDEICSTHNYSKKVITLNEQRGYVVARKN